MKFQIAALAVACLGGVNAFAPHTKLSTGVSSSSSSSLSMVLGDKPQTDKKLSKLEILKTKSDHLIHPLKEVSHPREGFNMHVSFLFGIEKSCQ